MTFTFFPSSMRRFAALLTALLAALPVAAENPKPGQWSQQSALSPDGQNWKPLPVRSNCMSAADAGRSVEQQIQLMVSQAAQAGCKPLDLKVGNGQARGRFECEQPGKPATIDVDGTYGADRYTMTMVGTNMADRNGSGLVIPKIYMKHEGRHTGACKS